jgi:hypothetical protein
MQENQPEPNRMKDTLEKIENQVDGMIAYLEDPKDDLMGFRQIMIRELNIMLNAIWNMNEMWDVIDGPTPSEKIESREIPESALEPEKPAPKGWNEIEGKKATKYVEDPVLLPPGDPYKLVQSVTIELRKSFLRVEWVCDETIEIYITHNHWWIFGTAKDHWAGDLWIAGNYQNFSIDTVISTKCEDPTIIANAIKEVLFARITRIM